MAIAAIAAPPMASTNFQSASNSFNGKTPYSQMGGSAPGWKSRAHAMRRNCFLHPPMPHSCVFYRSHAGLPARAVNVRLDQHIGWIESRLNVRADRAKGIKPFRARELNIAFLQVARGHIVEAGIAHHERQSIVRIAEMRATPAYNHPEVAFVLHTL